MYEDYVTKNYSNVMIALQECSVFNTSANDLVYTTSECASMFQCSPDCYKMTVLALNITMNLTEFMMLAFAVLFSYVELVSVFISDRDE